MSYLTDLRKDLLKTAIQVNDAAGVRTHIKVLVKLDEEPVSEYSLNLLPYVQRELVMRVESDQGVVDVFGEFLVLSVGSKAARVEHEKFNPECQVLLTVSSSPAYCRFYYGHVVLIRSPDVPMSDVQFHAVFEDKEPGVPKVERPKLTVVK